MYYPLTVAGVFFLTRFEFVFTFLDGNLLSPPPPSHQKAVQATGKLIQEITKALVVNTLGPYIWLISKSAAFDPVTSELLPLYRAAKTKTTDMGRQYSTHSNESITMKQTFNCAYYVRVTVLYCFCSFGVVRVCVFFSLVNVDSVATRKKASYFQWPSVRA